MTHPYPQNYKTLVGCLEPHQLQAFLVNNPEFSQTGLLISLSGLVITSKLSNVIDFEKVQSFQGACFGGIDFDRNWLKSKDLSCTEFKQCKPGWLNISPLKNLVFAYKSLDTSLEQFLTSTSHQKDIDQLMVVLAKAETLPDDIDHKILPLLKQVTLTPDQYCALLLLTVLHSKLEAPVREILEFIQYNDSEHWKALIDVTLSLFRECEKGTVSIGHAQASSLLLLILPTLAESPFDIQNSSLQLVYQCS